MSRYQKCLTCARLTRDGQCAECQRTHAHTPTPKPRNRTGNSSEYRRGWRQAKQAALARARGACQQCSNRHGLEVHHIWPIAEMVRWYGASSVADLHAMGVSPDDPGNLMVLCERCHDRAHSPGPLPPGGTPPTPMGGLRPGPIG